MEDHKTMYLTQVTPMKLPLLTYKLSCPLLEIKGMYKEINIASDLVIFKQYQLTSNDGFACQLTLLI